MTSRLTITALGCYRQVSRWFFQLKSSSRQNFINLLGFLGCSNLICKNTWSNRPVKTSEIPCWGQMHMGQGVSLSPLEFPTASNINPQLQPTALFTDFQHTFYFPVPVIMLTQTIHLEYHSSSSVTIHKNNGCHLLLLNQGASIPTFKSLKEFLSLFYRRRTRGSTKLSNVFIIYSQG